LTDNDTYNDDYNRTDEPLEDRVDERVDEVDEVIGASEIDAVNADADATADTGEVESAEVTAQRFEESGDIRDTGEVAQVPVGVEPSEADTSADFARPVRVSGVRARRRSQASTVIPALILIALGVWFLTDTLTPQTADITPALAIAVCVLGLGFALISRYVINGGRERGLLFSGVMLIVFTGLVYLWSAGSLNVMETYPLAVSAVGLALLTMAIFAPQSGGRGVVLPALILIVIGVAALTFTANVFTPETYSALATFAPLLLILPALLLIPNFRRRE
jgi:hypothetical protein